MNIEQKVGHVVTVIEGHLSRMTFDERQEFLDQLDDRLAELADDLEDEEADVADYLDDEDA